MRFLPCKMWILILSKDETGVPFALIERLQRRQYSSSTIQPRTILIYGGQQSFPLFTHKYVQREGAGYQFQGIVKLKKNTNFYH
ncbi:hypothetical protein AMECASPLE_005173 [Ameca splendens]|uniref:Uncharacterized protein n=1 Tax=Ameca splendens TaxID=208324 RepID=A0ABV0YA11_9TELE